MEYELVYKNQEWWNGTEFLLCTITLVVEPIMEDLSFDHEFGTARCIGVSGFRLISALLTMPGAKNLPLLESDLLYETIGGRHGSSEVFKDLMLQHGQDIHEDSEI